MLYNHPPSVPVVTAAGGHEWKTGRSRVYICQVGRDGCSLLLHPLSTGQERSGRKPRNGTALRLRESKTGRGQLFHYQSMYTPHCLPSQHNGTICFPHWTMYLFISVYTSSNYHSLVMLLSVCTLPLSIHNWVPGLEPAGD